MIYELRGDLEDKVARSDHLQVIAEQEAIKKTFSNYTPRQEH